MSAAYLFAAWWMVGPWLGVADAPATVEEAGTAKQLVFVGRTADGNQPVEATFDVVVEEGSDANWTSDGKMVVARVSAEGGSAQHIEAGGPWLGVQFGPVSKPLSSHLGLDPGVGQMVLNVIEGSPADLAGIGQFDVIKAIDGVAASDDIGAFLDKVRAFAPGEVHTFTLMRNGQETLANVTIGTRPETLEDVTYKYPHQAEELLQQHVFRRGGLLEKDDAGNWMFNRLELEDLPNVWNIMPSEQDPKFMFKVLPCLPQGGKSFSFSKALDDGRQLRIEQQNNGEITVTRTEAAGGQTNTTTNVYVDAEALKQGDIEAFDLYNQVKGRCFKFGDHADQFLRLHGLGLDNEAIRQRMEEAMRRAEEAMQNAQLQMPTPEEMHSMMEWTGASRPKTTFEVGANGQITVKVRQGDQELISQFSSEAELEQARPDLYEKYQRLQVGP